MLESEDKAESVSEGTLAYLSGKNLEKLLEKFSSVEEEQRRVLIFHSVSFVKNTKLIDNRLQSLFFVAM